MSSPNKPTQPARLEVRVSPALKALIEKAAAYTGQTVSVFVAAEVEVAAKKVIQEHDRLRLDETQSRALMEALLSAKKPTKRLKVAVDDYRRQVETR